MAVKAGTCYVKIDADFSEFNREVRAKLHERLTQEVHVKANVSGFQQAERDVKGFTGHTDKAHFSVNKLSGGLQKLYKDAAKITAVGLGAQAVSALGAAAVAATASLAPLAGALAAAPAVASAGVQAMGTWKLAFSGVSTAVGGLNQRLDQNSKAFRELTPEGKRFAIQLEAMKKPLRDLSETAQKGLLPGLQTGIQSAMKNFPILQRGIGDTAKILGNLAVEAGKLLGSKGFGRDLETQMGRNQVTIRRLGDAGLHLFDAIRHITLAAGPLVDWMTKIALAASKSIDAWARSGRESGKFTEFFKETRRVMTDVGRITGNLGVGLINIFKGAYPTGKSLLDILTGLSGKFKDWATSVGGQNTIRKFFEDAKPAMIEAGKLVGALVGAFATIGKGEQVAPLLKTIRVDLLPAFVGLVKQTTAAFGPAFIEAAKQILLLFTQLGGSSGGLVASVKLFGDMAQGVNWLIKHVPGLKPVITGLLVAGGISKALGLTSAISGVLRLTSEMRILRAVSALAGGEQAVGGVAGSTGMLARVLPLLTNPITLVVAGIAALGAAFYVAYHKIKPFHDWVDRTWKKFYTDHAQDFKAIGHAVSEMARVFISVALPILKRAWGGIEQIFKGAVQVIGGVIKVIGGLLTLNFGRVWSGVKDIFSGGIKAVLGYLRTMTAPVREIASRVFHGIATAASAAWRAVSGAISGLFRSAVRLIGGWIDDFYNVARRLVRGIANGISSAWRWVRDGVSGLLKAAIREIGGWVDDFARIGKRLITGLVNGIKSVWRWVTGNLSWILKQGVHALEGFWDDFVDIGKFLIHGIINGVKNVGKDLKNVVVDVAKGAWQGAKDFFGIGSPSKLMHDMGQQIVQGLANGLNRPALISGGLDKALTGPFDTAEKKMNKTVDNMAAEVRKSFTQMVKDIQWSTKTSGKSLDVMKGNFDGLATGVQSAISKIVSATNQILTALGAKPLKFTQTKGKQLGGRVGHWSGGWLGGRGMVSADDDILISPYDTAALGEAVVTRHQAPAIEQGMQIARMVTGGAYPYGSLDDVFGTITRPHGHQGGGRMRGHQGGGANFDGHPTNVTPGIRNLIATMQQRFPLIVTATTDGTHVAHSDHYSGHAVDLSADTGTMDRAAAWIMSSGLFHSLKQGIHNPNLSINLGEVVPSSFWGASTWAGHANHLHLALSGALGPAVQATVKRLIWHGGTDMLREIGQRATDKVRNAANNYISAHMPRTTGDMGVPGGLSGPVPRQMFQAGTSLGFNKIAIAGLIGNAVQESSLNPAISGGGAAGLFQWTPPDRLFAYAAAHGAPWQDVGTQMGAMASEYSGGRARLNSAGSPAEAATRFMNEFEKPLASAANLPHRIAAANQAFAQGYQRGGWLRRHQAGGHAAHRHPDPFGIVGGLKGIGKIPALEAAITNEQKLKKTKKRLADIKHKLAQLHRLKGILPKELKRIHDVPDSLRKLESGIVGSKRTVSIDALMADTTGGLIDSNKISAELLAPLTAAWTANPNMTDEQQDQVLANLLPGLLPRVQGRNQLDWLSKQLGDQIGWRNQLISARNQINRLLQPLLEAIVTAWSRAHALKAQIERINKKIRELTPKQKPLTQKQQDALKAQIKVLNDRIDTTQKRLKGKLTPDHRKSLEGQLKVYQDELSGKESQLQKGLPDKEKQKHLKEAKAELKQVQAEYDSLTGSHGVIPALQGQRDSFVTALGFPDNSVVSPTDHKSYKNLINRENTIGIDASAGYLGDLYTLEGPVSPDTQFKFLNPAQIVGKPLGSMVLGDILGVQKQIADFSSAFRIQAPTPDTTTAADVSTTPDQYAIDLARLDVERQAVLALQTLVLQGAGAPTYPFGGSFAAGGQVPGPPGAPRTIVAHGREWVVPEDQMPGGDTYVFIDGKGMPLQDLIDVRIEQRSRAQAKPAIRRLPGRGGR